LCPVAIAQRLDLAAIGAGIRLAVHAASGFGT
jgi:hypothetical protein